MLHIYDLQVAPKKAVVKWTMSPQPPWSQPPVPAGPPTYPAGAIYSPQGPTYWNQLVREIETSLGTFVQDYSGTFTTQTTYDDTNINLGARYRYQLKGGIVTWVSTYNSANGTYYWVQGSNPWSSAYIYLKLAAIALASAGTVDSRLDLRFATNKLLDYPFGAVPASGGTAPTRYRGGLFAGYNADNAKVGRSFLRFDINSFAAGLTTDEKRLWPLGGLIGFVPRLAKSGSVTAVLRSFSENTIPPPGPLEGIVWTTQPSFGGQDMARSTISWSSSSPQKQWIALDCAPWMQEALNVGGKFSMALLSSSETTSGWLYLARPGYTDPTYSAPSPNLIPSGNGLSPFLLFALQGPGANLSTLTLNPTSVTSGTSTTVTGTVSMSSFAPPGGFQVALSTSSSDASVPSSVTIPAGQSGASFNVTWNNVATTTTVDIVAAMGNIKTATLTIVGNGGGGGNGTTISTFSISPPIVVHGANATGTITLAGAAPSGGTVVTLSSSNTNAAQVPASVTVPAGMTSKTFTITTGPGVQTYPPVTITATASNTKTAALTVF